VPERISVNGGFPANHHNSFGAQDRLVIDPWGYSYIASQMASELSPGSVVLNTEVVLINRTGKGAVMHTETFNPDYAGDVLSCATYHAKKVISTASVGVLTQRASLLFDPPFPQSKLNDMNAVYNMGLFYKLFFSFPTKFWGDGQIISIAAND